VSTWLALACWAATAGDPSAADSLPNHLSLRIAAQPSVIAAVGARLAPRLAALGVALDLAPVAEVNIERVLEVPPDNSPDAPLARAWLNAGDIDSAILLLIPRRADRVLMRKVPLTLGVDEAGLAQITFIIERSVASLLASEPIGVPHAEARAALDAALPARVSDEAAQAHVRQTALQVGVFGGLAAWSSDAHLAPRMGLDLWFDWITDGRLLGVAASAAADPAFHSTDANGDLMVRAISVHGWLTAGRQLGRLGVGRVAFGPALLVTHVAPTLARFSPTDVVAGAARTDVDPVIGFAARWDLPLERAVGGGALTAFLAATVDFVPLRAQYSELVDGAKRELFSPWPVRPGLVLGVSVGSGRQRR
jgi:hypothetical protein